MDIKDFVKDVLIEIDQAVKEANLTTHRQVYLRDGTSDHRTVEFDLAVSATTESQTKGKAGVKVLELIEGGGEHGHTSKNSTVSRIKFGIDFNTQTKEEEAKNESIGAGDGGFYSSAFNRDF